jgi:hypothetical protein
MGDIRMRASSTALIISILAATAAAAAPRVAHACNSGTICYTSAAQGVVSGQDTTTTGNGGIGVVGSTSIGLGVYGSASPGAGIGVEGNSVSGIGVVGVGDASQDNDDTPPSYGYGVWGTSGSFDGVHGDVDNSASGVAGVNSGTGRGVTGQNTYSSSCPGSSCDGVFGTSTKGYGVEGQSTNSNGVVGDVNNTLNGVVGVQFYTGTCGGSGQYCNGVYGASAAGAGSGVYGTASGTNGYGVYGTSTYGIGVYGVTGNDTGVSGYGSGTDTNGTYGNCAGTNCYGVLGACSGSGCYAGYFNGNVHITGTLTCGGSCNSDRRLKQDIEPLTGALDKLTQLRGVTFKWKNPEEHENHTGTQTGLIAQEVQTVFPQWVRENEKGTLNVDVDPRAMAALTVESIRALKTDNDLLKERVAALESGRQPRISGFNLNGVGFGVGGLALGLGLVISRRKREGRSSQ